MEPATVGSVAAAPSSTGAVTPEEVPVKKTIPAALALVALSFSACSDDDGGDEPLTSVQDTIPSPDGTQTGTGQEPETTAGNGDTETTSEPVATGGGSATTVGG